MGVEDMEVFLNYGLAWIGTLIAVILAAKFFVRKGAQKQNSMKSFMVGLNKIMRKTHIFLGVTLIIVGFIHGYNSSFDVWSINIGTITWVLSILLGINWMIRKRMKNLGAWIYYHRILTVIFMTTLVCHIVEVGGIQIFKVLGKSDTRIESKTSIGKSNGSVGSSNNSEVSSDNAEDNENSSQSGGNDIVESYNEGLAGVVLKDGTYSGEASGYQPGLTVEVVVNNNKIVDITVTDHNEVNSRFYQRPINEIPQEIIDAQSLEVDTVSGATFTSIGIINAVNDALSQALVSGTLPDMKQLPQNRRGRH